MERRLTKKCEDHLTDFKTNIKDWFQENNSNVSGNMTTSDFLKFIYDFDNVAINKDDFLKRKRVKTHVPQYERCCANRANNEQCTRRKHQGCEYCGTHQKGRPYGVVNNEKSETEKYDKIEIFIKEIRGINYYLDNKNNVYKAEDIISNKLDPDVIAHYLVMPDGSYTLPQFHKSTIS